MGNLCESRPTPEQRQAALIEQEQIKMEAYRTFNIRVTSYSYPHHGPYIQYIEQCRAQYQLDCIPKRLQHGSMYVQDPYGNTYGGDNFPRDDYGNNYSNNYCI